MSASAARMSATSQVAQASRHLRSRTNNNSRWGVAASDHHSQTSGTSQGTQVVLVYYVFFFKQVLHKYLCVGLEGIIF